MRRSEIPLDHGAMGELEDRYLCSMSREARVWSDLHGVPQANRAAGVTMGSGKRAEQYGRSGNQIPPQRCRAGAKAAGRSVARGSNSRWNACQMSAKVVVQAPPVGFWLEVPK